MATFMERLAFLQNVPTLMKATADDENPCPGYLFQEIGKISQESPGCGQCLLEYLLERLQVDSCHVKLKVLKLFVHLCGHGSQPFLTELRRNSTFIQQAAVYSGPPDPIHGTALYQKVRTTAQELASLLFTDTGSSQNCLSPCTPATPTMGMGSESSHRSGMQGFGYSPGKRVTGSDTILDKIQKAAEVVASAVLPPTEHQGIRLHDNHYRAVAAPAAPIEVAVPACAYTMPPHKPKASKRCPGQVGGGWEEIDSGHSSSHNSSQENAANSRVSGGGSSKSGGTDSQSGASRESGDLSERVEAMQLGDCGQEVALISRLVEGSRVFLSREESQHFIKECSILNCEVVVELLSRRLQDPSNTVQMRALCAVACLMTSDLLSLEQILGATQRRLAQLSEGSPGPVANKATKILRQFEALMGGAKSAARRDAAPDSVPPSAPSYSAPLLLTHPVDFTTSHLESDPQSKPPPLLTPPPPMPCPEGDYGRSLYDDEEDEEEETLTPQNDYPLEGPTGSRTMEPQLPGFQNERGALPFLEHQPQQPCVGRLSLFTGMELVTRPGCTLEREGDLWTRRDRVGVAQRDSRQNSGFASTNTMNSPLLSPDETSDGPPLPMCDIPPSNIQSVSAFSFLNL
ncbi:AP-4 complex accessory subunit Tepsin [Osmerus mordax]|uniref:AP-4 complex accessory subunit Tepsin n=1 Tax=Osmerus mordax TaxID=8014 RepID=UPI00350F2B21